MNTSGRDRTWANSPIPSSNAAATAANPYTARRERPGLRTAINRYRWRARSTRPLAFHTVLVERLGNAPAQRLEGHHRFFHRSPLPNQSSSSGPPLRFVDEAPLGPLKSALGGRQRHPARGGYLRDFHPLDEPQREGDVFVDGELLEDCVHSTECTQRREVRAARHSLCALLVLLIDEQAKPAPPRPGSQHLARREGRDLSEPRPEGARVLERADRRKRVQEDILHDVGKLVVEANDACDDALYVRGVTVEECGLGPRVMLAERADESGIVAGEAERKNNPVGPGRWLGVTHFGDHAIFRPSSKRSSRSHRWRSNSSQYGISRHQCP